MEDRDKMPQPEAEQALRDEGSQKYDENVPAEGDDTRVDFEAMSLEELNAETNVTSTEDFGSGGPTGEDEVDDSGIGSDVDDMINYGSGQADY